MLKPVFENPWVRAGALLGAVVGFVVLLFLLKSVLVPLFFAFILAYMFDPVVDRFEARYKSSRMLAVLVLVSTLLLLAILGPLLVMPSIISQAEDLMKAASSPTVDTALNPKDDTASTTAEDTASNPTKDPASTPSEDTISTPAEDTASTPTEETASNPAGKNWLDRALGKLPLENWAVSLGWMEEGQEDFNARTVIAQKLGAFVRENAATFMKQYGQETLQVGGVAGDSATSFFTYLKDSVFGILGFLGNFVLFTFIWIYLLKDYDRIIEGIDALLPSRHRLRVRDLAGRIDSQLHGFMRGQLTVCVFLGLMYTIGMIIGGTPFAVPLGIFGGIASFIPYVGIVITMIPALLLTLLQHGIDWHIGVVLTTFVIAQFLEGNVITPKLVGEQVGLGPVWVILAVIVFSNTFGFLGLLLALPIAAVLKVFVEDALIWYKQSDYFVDDTPGGGNGDSAGI